MILVIILKLMNSLEQLKTLRLVAEAHQRDLKIMLDIVINHTSTHHEWFKEAMRSKDSPYRDYYFFRESNDGPPTNWGV